MKISTRLNIAFLVASVVPMLIVGAWSLYRSQQALTQLGEASILQSAEAVARQAETYLAAHPELDVTNAAQLQADAGLGRIAVQQVGQTGYTVIFDREAITYFHPSAGLIGEYLGNLAGDLPEFWAILSASLEGDPTAGYYDWDDEGKIRAKYMYIVPVGDTPLRVAATTYIDEFSQPVARFRLEMMAIMFVVALAALVGANLFSRRLCRPINAMVQATARIADGDLRIEPPATSVGELEQLAAAFARMAGNLGSLIRQVQAMSLNLSSAAGQVMMTQRLHATNSEEQAAAVSNASAAVEELTSSSIHIADTAQRVVAAAGQTQTNARQGVAAMEDTTRRLEGIAAGNRAAVDRVRELGELARQIGAVMDLIEDIATQTRLIAFNASIEASVAGEAGRRFAVVAGEVRRLASNVSQSADEIRARVELIQTTTNELIIASERERKEIEGGLDTSQATAGLLDQIYGSAEQTTVAVEQISFSTQQQRTATEQLLEDLQPLTTGATAIAAGNQQTVTVMEDLVTMARDLQAAANRFSLPEEKHDTTIAH
jgi:methyl-accepting chemotaxis protein